MGIDYVRLRNLNTRKLVRALQQDGFLLKRQKGSHVQMVKPGFRTIVIQESNSVPVFHILANIKTAGITREEYLKALEEI